MNFSPRGQFYGKSNQTLFLNGIVLNDADYVCDRVDWHYHENAYFTFLLEGMVLDGNRKDVHENTAGDVMFQNCQDPHYNIGSKLFTRGFHVEIDPSWFTQFDIPANFLEGSVNIKDPVIKLLMYNIFRETKLFDGESQLGIDNLLVQLIGALRAKDPLVGRQAPAWVSKVKEALHASPENWSLTDLAKLANVHPVHLSRQFPKYFKTSIGEYVRMIRIQKALTLLPNRNMTLTEISNECGFADQSHFIRCFRFYQRLSPLQYRRFLQKSPIR